MILPDLQYNDDGDRSHRVLKVCYQLKQITGNLITLIRFRYEYFDFAEIEYSQKVNLRFLENL